MATIYEVSTLAGVSLATVSRVINKNSRVSDKTRQKVLDAMSELGYRPNSIAQSLASKRSNSVGILVPELSGSYHGQLMAGVEAELRAAGKHVIITTGYSEEDKEKDGIEFLMGRNCDAIIIHVEALSDAYLIALCKGKVPVYLMSRYVEEISEHCISLDNELGGYLATTAVIEEKHSNIAYISGPLFKPDAKERLEGHQRALTHHGLSIDNALIEEGNFRETGGSEGLKNLLEKNIPFSALVCANDEMASGAMTYARELGLALPEQLSIIGFDDNMFAKHIHPQLTTINNPVFEMGGMAAKLVLRDVYQQKGLSIKHFFEPSLITRNSVIRKVD